MIALPGEQRAGADQALVRFPESSQASNSTRGPGSSVSTAVWNGAYAEDALLTVLAR
jgi:hypothetical protein